MIPVLLLIALATGGNPSEIAAPEKAAVVEKPAAKEQGSERKKPTLRRSDSQRERTEPKAKDDAPPAVEKRAIPEPDEEPKRSELDMDLLGELGQDLEAANDDEDPLLRAGRRMREVETRLMGRDASRATLELQKKIVADLEELLKPPSGNPPPPPSKNKPKPKSPLEQAKGAQKQQQKMASKTATKATRPAEKAGPPPQTIREEFGNPEEIKDVWGHLSAMLREEMSQHAKETFLEKYRDLLEQYYANIAAQSRSSR